MRCRSCGTEIADKALVCYRCGHATTDPTFKPSTSRPSRSPLTLVTSALALALLVVVALFMQRGVTVGTSPGLRWLIVVCAVAIVVLRAVARRVGR